MVAARHVWLLNVARVIEKLHFKFFKILIHLNVNSHMWVVATLLGRLAVDPNDNTIILLFCNTYLLQYFCKEKFPLMMLSWSFDPTEKIEKSLNSSPIFPSCENNEL